MHRMLPAVLAAALLAPALPTPAVHAQTPADPTPLSTPVKPADRPATDTVPVRPGTDGDAPGDEILARPGTPAQPAAASDAASPGTAAAALDAETARALVGRPVVASDLRPVGTVRDFLRGTETGAVDRMVIDRGGSEPAGALVAIPVHQVRIPEAGGDLRLTVGAADLEQMEPFSYAGRDEDALVGER